MAMKPLCIPLAPTIKGLSPAELAYLLEQKPMILKWLSAATERALGMSVATPGSVPGWGVGPGARSRGWDSDAAAIQTMGRLGVNDVYVRAVKTVPQVESAVGEDALAEYCDATWRWAPGKPKLVRAMVVATPPDTFDW